jgi:hypothetical protein
MSETQRFCEHCGAPMRETARFCGKCGQAATTEPASQPAPQPAAQLPQSNVQPQACEVAEQALPKKRSSVLGRLLIILVGLALLFLGLRGPILGVIGESASAVVTSVTETDEDYTYTVAYRFTAPDGKSASGSLTQEALNITTLPDVGGFVTVRYLPAWPSLNVPAKQSAPSLSNLGLAALGLALVLFSGKVTWRTSKKRR